MIDSEVSTNEANVNVLVLRLERTQNNLVQLENQLNSYKCEPKTYSLYEGLEKLKEGIAQWNRSNSEIILALRKQKKSIGNYVEKVTQQLAEFNNIMLGVKDYRAQCSGY